MRPCRNQLPTPRSPRPATRIGGSAKLGGGNPTEARRDVHGGSRECSKLFRAFVVLVSVCGAVLVFRDSVSAEEITEKERATVRKTYEKLHFELPPDWPIEKRNGMVAPIPVEEYLAHKFKALDQRFQGLEQRVNGLELRFRVLEESGKRPGQGLKSQEQPGP